MKTLNYITTDAWWDTDVTILPELCKHYAVNVFVAEGREEDKYPVKQDYGFRSFLRYKSPYHNWDIRKMPRSLRFFHAIWKACRKPGVVNLTILGGDPYCLVLLRFFLRRRNTIVASHNYIEHVDSRRSPFARVNRWYFSHFRRFLFFSDLQRAMFHNDFPHKEAYAISMPLKDFGSPTKPRTDFRPTFLFFGALRDYKRPDVFIQAANRIPSGQARFIIAGKPFEWEKYDALIADRTNFHLDIRFIDNAEIPDYFSQADFLVLPYEDATQSGPLLIAVNYGVPVIATRLPAFQNMIDEGRNGYLFPAGDVEALADIFTRVVEGSKTNIDAMKRCMLDKKREYVKKHNVVECFDEIIRAL